MHSITLRPRRLFVLTDGLKNDDQWSALSRWLWLSEAQPGLSVPVLSLRIGLSSYELPDYWGINQVVRELN